MFQHVLVVYDGSKQSLTAFDYALGIAAGFGSKLRVLSVVCLPEPATRLEFHAATKAGEEHFRQDFERLAARAGERVCFEDRGHGRTSGRPDPPRRGSPSGRPHRPGTARQERGRALAARLDSERLLRAAPCPVLVVQ